MSSGGSFYAEIPEKRLVLSVEELSARLGIRGEYPNDLISECERKLRKVLECRYAAVRIPVFYPGKDKIDLGFGAFFSHSLYKNLSRCDEAFIFAVTLGYGADRLLGRLSAVSAAEYFITDALASAFAEAASEYTDKEIKGALKCRPRFSPGYGDFPLEFNRRIAILLDISKKIGVTITPNNLLIPQKSMLGLIGIGSDKRKKSCENCVMKEDCPFRKRGQRCYRND